MTAAHYKGGHHPGNDLGLHYTALPPIVASCPYSDQLLVTRKFWSPGANRPSQASDPLAFGCGGVGSWHPRPNQCCIIGGRGRDSRRCWRPPCIRKGSQISAKGELALPACRG